MSFRLFHDEFPELVEQETRTLIVRLRTRGVPPDRYAFHEMFCDDRKCDCRRAFFMVMSALHQQVEAVVSWGWETPAFYAKWLCNNDIQMGTACKGPFIEAPGPSTSVSRGILEMTKSVLLADLTYVERVKQHYCLFKDKIGAKPPRKRYYNGVSGTRSMKGRNQNGRSN